MATVLNGMTWNHPRGLDPMVAAAADYRARTGVEVTWDARSLQDFESFPVDELARRYDLIVIDHPHVGRVTADGCLLPLDGIGRDAELAAIAAGSVGRSFSSYTWRGRQWALPIDAATQVQAFRPDRLDGPLRSFEAVLDLARAGRVAIPLRPPHSLMCFFTLAAHAGTPCSDTGPALIGRDAGIAVLERLRALAAAVDPACFAMDPIAVFEAMAEPDSPVWCAPLIYGYVSYARPGFRARRLAFADMPTDAGRPPVGSALGGTGIAVSALRGETAAAVDFACFVASGAVQRGVYAAGGGQPGHAAAWDDPAVDAAAGGFYRGTRASLEGAWVRPRHDGYMTFQHEAAELVNEALTSGGPAGPFVDRLVARFAASLPTTDHGGDR